MGKFDKLKKQNQQVVSEINEEASHLLEVSDEYKRVSEIYSAPSIILSDIDSQFCAATKLNKADIAFLFFATALQCIRQYFLTQFKSKDERPGDGDAASNTFGHHKKHSNRGIHYYNPSFQEIKNNPVPFDAIRQADHLKGVFKDTGHFGHRTTLGHDPLLGWVFGTANIATSTLTTWDLRSYHVKTGVTKHDKIVELANTASVFTHTTNKLLAKEGQFTEQTLSDSIFIENKADKFAGPAIIALSLILEWDHLRSDIDSIKSLPFPIVTTISPDLAGTLAKYGIDMCNIKRVGQQASYSMLINFLVATVHRMLYDESCGLSQSMYEVKTRKILKYSNVIASASNIIAVAVTEAIAVATKDVKLAKKGVKYLDIGGLAVTIYRLINDTKFINSVKMEFIENEWYNAVVGDDYSFIKEELK